MIFGINTARAISKLSQISLTYNRSWSWNYEWQFRNTITNHAITYANAYKVPIYECTSAFCVHVQRKRCLVSQISRRDHAFMLAWIKAWSGGWGKAAKVLTNDRVVYSRESLWRVLLQHTTPWGQLIHWPLTKLGLLENCSPMPTLTQR